MRRTLLSSLALALLLCPAAILLAGGQGEETGDTGERVITALSNFGNTLTVEPDEMPSFQRWYEETGIKIEWEIIRTDWEARKSLVLASNDLPDTFWGNRTILITDLASNRPRFVPLNDYIDDSTNIAQMFADEPGMRGLVTFPDGQIYSLPHRMPLRPDSFQGNYINKTWLDTLGLEVPQTLDEFTDVLRAFKTQDPNGNGLADEIPWSFPGTGTAFGVWWMFGSFGLANNVFERFAMVDGEPVFIPVTENYRDAVRYLRDVYAEGLIDQEVFVTGDWGLWLPKCQQTDPTIMGVAGMWTTKTLMGNTNAANYVTLPPLVNEEYGELVYPYNPIQLRSSPVTWTLTTAAKDPDAAFEFMDHIYASRESVQLYFGPYGVGLERQNDGTVLINDPPDPDQVYDDFLWSNGFGDMGPFYVGREFERTIVPNGWVQDKLDIDAVYQPYLTTEVYPSMIFSEADSRELSILQTDIVNVVENKLAAWITGEGDIESDWDAYVEDLYRVGLDRYLEIHKARHELYESTM